MIMAALGRTILRSHDSFFAVCVPLLVRLPLKWLLGMVEPPRWFRPYRACSVIQIQALVDARLASPAMMKRRKCLRHGLVLYHFLRLAGYNAQLHFGVFPPADGAARLHGHCWVSLDGRPISLPPEQGAATMHIRNSLKSE